MYLKEIFENFSNHEIYVIKRALIETEKHHLFDSNFYTDEDILLLEELTNRFSREDYERNCER